MKKAMNHSEVKDFLPAIEHHGFGISKKDRFEKTDKSIIVNGEPMFFFIEDKPIPTIRALMKKQVLKTITVDMGAVRFVIAGADIMRPGITAIDDGIQKDDFVAVKEVSHGKILAVGISLFSSGELRDMKTGKAVKNVHWVGDEVWNDH